MVRFVVGVALVLGCTPAPEPASVEIVRDEQPLRLRARDTLQLTAVVRDSAGTQITGAMVTWSTPDTGILEVSMQGVVSVKPRLLPNIVGTTVVASIDGLSDSLQIGVFDWVVDVVVDRVRESTTGVALLNPVDPAGGSLTIWCTESGPAVGLSTASFLRSASVVYRFAGSSPVEIRNWNSPGGETTILEGAAAQAFLAGLSASDSLFIELHAVGNSTAAFDLRNWDLVLERPEVGCLGATEKS